MLVAPHPHTHLQLELVAYRTLTLLPSLATWCRVAIAILVHLDFNNILPNYCLLADRAAAVSLSMPIVYCQILSLVF